MWIRSGLLASVLCAPAYALPVDVPVQGRLVDALGEPIIGDHNLELSIFTEATGGTLLHRETFSGVALEDGRFGLILGKDVSNPLQDAVLLDPTFLALTVDGEALSVRQPLYRPVVATSVHGGSAWVTEVQATSTIRTPLLDADAVDAGTLTAQSIDSGALSATDITTQTLDIGQAFSAPEGTFDDANIGQMQATSIDTQSMTAQSGRLGSVTSDSTQTTVDRLTAADTSVDGTLSVTGNTQAGTLSATGPTSLRDSLSVSRDATFLQGVSISGPVDSASVQTRDVRTGGLTVSQDATFSQGVSINGPLDSASVQTGDVQADNVGANGTVQANAVVADQWLVIPEGFRCLNAPDGSLLRNGDAIGLCMAEQWVPLHGDATPEFIDTPEGKQWDAGPDTSCRGYQETGLAHGRVTWPRQGDFVVDPDGNGPLPPSTAYCDVFRGWQLMLVYRTEWPDYDISPLPATRPTTVDETAPGSHEYPIEAGYPPGTVEGIKLECWIAGWAASHVREELTNPADVQYFEDGIGPAGRSDYLLVGADLLPNVPDTFSLSRWSSYCGSSNSIDSEFQIWWR